MLLCLSREERLAILLVEVLGATDAVGAAICEVSAPAFRKRLERARRRLVVLLQQRCGLFDEGNACRCRRQAAAMQKHRGLPLDWALQPTDLLHATEQMEKLSAVGRVFALDPPVAPPEQLFRSLEQSFPELLR